MTTLARSAAALALAVLLAAPPVAAESWTAIWNASPQRAWQGDAPFPTGLPAEIAGKVVRQPLTLGYPAGRLRLVLSNVHGTRPLPVAEVSLGRSTGGAQTEDTLPVRFGGAASVVIAPGAEAVSDPVALPVEVGARIAATLRYGDGAVAGDFHWDARETSYLIDADRPAPEILGETTARISLAGVLSDRPARMGVVAMGDSITDGNGAPMDGQARWPDFLARALSPDDIAVVNAGISGGRLLSDGMGQSVLARLGRDALGQPGAGTVVLLIGTNDIAWPGSPFAPDEPPMTLERLQAGLRQVAAQVRAAGGRLVLGTLPPFRGALPGTPMEDSYWSPGKDQLRRALNDWLRQADIADALADFDAVLRDPADPSRLAAEFDSGDRLHPGAAGNRAMAQAVAEVLRGG
ncbi:SGNH/GDSL hydrolase family protein [Poseidonocella sp. HB161398]|uniref:SGNH/GDSL hydrolase family protein n=1 Tax=Poseidonocella sp. HB161398 TaxID=2320855 RepID=UPI001107E179|nr:SGNH/GDSL hydrolase family protein [Poseidonocella sp. HB161398]